MELSSVSVRVPGSTSNLGPGFDTLGLALTLYTHLQITRAAEPRVRLTSPVPEPHQPGAAFMLTTAAGRFFAERQIAPFGVDVSLSGDVPIGRGLGFSATVRAGLLAGLNALSGSRWDGQRLLEEVTALEGHPDNASPALKGGFTVSSRLGPTVRCLHFPVNPHARFVTLVPTFAVLTEQARKLVPETFSKPDTVHNLNRSALIAAAFASGQLAALRGCFEDRVHQPYREKLIPQLSQVIRAGEGAGAIGGWLSGSGSAIICLTLTRADEVAQAMQSELPQSQVRVLSAENEGLTLQKSI